MKSLKHTPTNTNLAALTSILKKRGLNLNKSKTEENIISNKHHEWKNCKFLGSFINTDSDIKSRKSKLLNAAEQLKHVSNNPRISISTKTKIFDVYLSTIFLYNSELRTLTETMLNGIDSFHRRMLRTLVLNVKYPKVVKNEEVYALTKQSMW